MLWYNSKIHEGPQSNNPWGNSWVSDEIKRQYYDQGWQQVADDFIPEIVLTTQQKIDNLNNEYLPEFEKLKSAIQGADADGNTDRIASLKAAYVALHTEYNTKMEAITG